ncbi:MAG TPA: sigma-54-dependent Fis family transcriptional regulator [Deltaproteobacteria bacterium]|nr:sigma-54-dependent Fis family transcriptional regulator [Deltaproteobacteria bacterium]
MVTAKRKVLLVEDNESVCEAVSEMLAMAGYEVKALDRGEGAVEMVKDFAPDILLTDLKLPGMDGIEVVRRVKETDPNVACIVITGYGTVESAVDAMKAGAFTYLRKPYEKDELLVILDKAYEVHSLTKENRSLRREMKRRSIDAILGTSEAIQNIRDIIEKVADTDSTVLILGESGTGKELVARALHYQSSRSDKPFVPINCGAIPEDLLESELFGYEKGAFTGAIATKIGRIEAADGGTVFLDEIGDMSPALQVKILRVLQEKEFERIGGRKTIQVDIRVVAATNQDLEKAVAERRFREDLFYRLNVIPIVLPPLRERPEDVTLLADHFVKTISERKGKKITGFAPEVLAVFENYDWPGNVRELENLIERLVVLKGSGRIGLKDLPERMLAGRSGGQLKPPPAGELTAARAPFTIPPEGVDFNALVDNFERELILTALRRVNGVKKKAADFLRLNRTTLIEKMKRKGLIDEKETVES